MRSVALLVLLSGLGCLPRLPPVESDRWNTSGSPPNDPAAFPLRSIAGEYDRHSPGGGGALRIEKDGRWTFRHVPFFIGESFNSGTARISGETVVLEENDAIGFPTGKFLVLTPVRWGERRYLLGPGEFAEFCNHINWGFEPERSMWGRFLLLDEGAERANIIHPVEGPPELPAEWAKHILREPVAGVVRERLPEGRLRVDIGAAEGVFLEMDLRAVDERGVNLTFLHVVSLSEHESVLEPSSAPEGAMPDVGWKVTCNADGRDFAPR